MVFAAIAVLGAFAVACNRHAAPQSARRTAGSTAAAPAEVITPYLAIQEGLAKDSLDGLRSNADAVAAGARTAGASDVDADAQKLASASTLADARERFGTLSEALVADSHRNGWTLPDGVREAWCPMVKKPWLQRGSMMANPYFGKEMPTCGEFK